MFVAVVLAFLSLGNCLSHLYELNFQNVFSFTLFNASRKILFPFLSWALFFFFGAYQHVLFILLQMNLQYFSCFTFASSSPNVYLAILLGRTFFPPKTIFFLIWFICFFHSYLMVAACLLCIWNKQKSKQQSEFLHNLFHRKWPFIQLASFSFHM